ncbi:hypothetical protein N0V82_006015 [Gnomoniopsis sp. IMI 355080]|nr:hypothetical protein N0V82_006015 [Gnomoniopsis sp. IMI 355080]
MITPAPQVNKSFDPPLAARPIPIRTGSLSPDQSPARSNRARAVRLRQATSMLGLRSLQGISHLRSLTTLPHKARDRSASNNSGSSRSVASRKGTRERPLVIGWPVLLDNDGESTNAVLERPILASRIDNEKPTVPLPMLESRLPMISARSLDMDALDKLRAPTLARTARVKSPEECIDTDRRNAGWTEGVFQGSTDGDTADNSSAKRVGGVEIWESVDIDHDALQDALEDDPKPLDSNPTSEHDEDEPRTPWTTMSSTVGEPELTEAMASYWQRSRSPSPCTVPRRRLRSISLATASAFGGTAEQTSLPSSPVPGPNSMLDKQPCACDTVPRLRKQLANLSACSSALLALQAAHEETIAILHDNLRNQDTTISRQENAIADLTWQAQAKETEQVSIIENLCAEIASESREIAKLGEDKWYLMGRVEELELKMATIEDPLGRNRQEPVKPREATLQGSVPRTANGMGVGDTQDDVDEVKSESLEASPHSASNSPKSDPAANSEDTTETPSATLSSLSSPCTNRSLYAMTPTKGTRQASDVCISNHDVGQRGLLTSPHCESKHSRLINTFGTKEGSNVAHQYSRQSRDGQTMAAQAVLGAKVILDERLAGAQEKLATSEAHNAELQAQVACQGTLIQQLTCMSAGSTSTSPAHLPIPDLPVLKYTTSATVWADRVRSAFAYLGLLDFIQRDVPQPGLSTWDATEVTDWTTRRLRAVVLLKQAVDDDILEDVLYLQGRNETTPDERAHIQSTPAMDDPYQLLNTITSLRRIISATATDLSWLDRIRSADFNGIESFTSLVLCVDRRHGVMYGTAADHFEALLPKLQETMAKFFPEMKGSMFPDDSDSGLRKWRQLPIWMAKVVKRRQTS